MLITRLILDGLLILMLVGTGGGKLLQVSSSLAIRDSLNLSNRLWKIIGVLELIAVVGLTVGAWLPLAGLAASVGVILLMIGAVVVRVRAGQRSASPFIVDVVVLLIAVVSAMLHALAL